MRSCMRSAFSHVNLGNKEFRISNNSRNVSENLIWRNFSKLNKLIMELLFVRNGGCSIASSFLANSSSNCNICRSRASAKASVVLDVYLGTETDPAVSCVTALTKTLSLLSDVPRSANFDKIDL